MMGEVCPDENRDGIPRESSLSSEISHGPVQSGGFW